MATEMYYRLDLGSETEELWKQLEKMRKCQD